MRSLSHHDGPGDLIQHPSAKVTFDLPPVTEESIARAKAAAAQERAEIDALVRFRDDDMLELSAMVDRHGWRQVADWLMGIQRMSQDGRRI
jgi:hypothetical protein